MYLQSLVNVVPERAFSQRECWDIFINSETPKRLKNRSVAIIRKILLGDNGIARRHFALQQLEKLFELDAESLNRAFEIEAPALARRAIEGAMDQASLQPENLDALFVCTCTGYICPGISSHVAEQIGMRPDVYLQDLVGLGCGAAIPTLRSASHFLSAQPEARVAVIAVEICSAAFYLDDDPGVLVSACLFGDGASASIWSMERETTGLYCEGFDTLHMPENRELLRFENRQGKLRNRLHKSVPEKAAEAVRCLFDRQNGAPIDQVISHTGGRDVIQAIEAALPGIVLEESAKVLKNNGNMSSPSVLFALKEYLDHRNVENDLWLTAFGAGFSCHSCRISRKAD